MGRLLDEYDNIQRRPVGSISARNSDAGLRNMRSQRAVLTSALRKGIRNARKAGDAAGVLSNLNVANAYGVQATGIGNYDNRQAADRAYESQIRQETSDNERVARTARAAEGGNGRQAAADALVKRYVNTKGEAFADGIPAEDEAEIRRLGGTSKSFQGAVARRADSVRKALRAGNKTT